MKTKRHTENNYVSKPVIPLKDMGKPLKIGIFMDDFFPSSGGVARSIQLQISELMKAGHVVTLFAPKVHFRAPECEYVAMPVWWITGTPSFLCSIRFGEKIADEIARSYDFDIVHSQNERGAMFLAAQIAKISKATHVHTFHSNYAGTHATSRVLSLINSMTFMSFAPFMMSKIRSDKTRITARVPSKLPNAERSYLARRDWKLVAKLAQYVDGFTAPAPYVIDAINSATRDKLKDRGFVVPNGVASEVFLNADFIRPLDGKVRFLSCGRLDAEKRVDKIIKAFAKLSKDNARLFIVGDGTKRRSLEKLARRKVKHGKVLFLGEFGQRERVANEMANSDVFVFASYRFDTQGMVLAEAACAGVPIIYCDDRMTVGVNKDNSLLTSPSVSGIAAAMKQLYVDKALRLSMSQASRKLATSLSSDVMMDRFVTVYRRSIEHAAIINK